MEGSCILTYKAANMMKGRCYKSVNSKGETTAVIIIMDTIVDNDYVIAVGTYANCVTDTIKVCNGKMNLAMWSSEERHSDRQIPLEYRHYILYDTISEISMEDAKEVIYNITNKMK